MKINIKRKIPHSCQNSSKIQSENRRNRSKYSCHIYTWPLAFLEEQNYFYINKDVVYNLDNTLQ